ncbi:MAG: AAA family ATPase, partial [candidate division Zixibacteria bacterium]|nr:AAA family ATPase [candidate division Zixibacteria bacterium]NIS45944.1 AAA family ATPase [candidate division Zixibacteria bacterium]NIU14076.1 AAA family ATPase [candidate division Zixibacteria bacterium]NIV06109.1 AAA family ATPase [candidate division Zixibacteria bacterium]NIW44893.1 AAA family ATPase [Gammaproteobacteria bacterium]
QKKTHQLLSSPFPVESIETRTVGRGIQFKRLKDVFHKTVETNEQHIVLLAGEAGIGKSRLLSEFDRWLGLLPRDLDVLIGFGHPSTTNQPYSIIRDLISSRFGINGSDSSSEIREKLESGVRRAVSGKTDWQSAFQHIGKLLGFEIGENPGSQKQTRNTKSFYNQALVYLEKFFKNLTLEAPLVILLEDLHWTDDSSLKLITHINTHLTDYPILIAATTRPSFFSQYPADWLKD